MDPKDLKKQLIDKRNQSPLVISRIPPNTRKRFHEIANYDDFCSDFGMVIKYLIDIHDGVVPTGNEEHDVLQEQIDILKAEITALKTEQSKAPVRKMLCGEK